MPRLFESQTLDLGHPFIRHLIDTGYDDLTFINSKVMEEPTDANNSSKRDSERGSVE
ncbi:hypothetical protein D3C74_483450 [compost metagenome]